MKVIITGASGFLGSYLVLSLLEKGHFVRAIGRTEDKLKELSDRKNYDFRISDYSFNSLVEVTKGYDVIFHFASQLMQRDTHKFMISKFSNLQLLENVLLAAKENKILQVIQTSSISVYSELNVYNKEYTTAILPKSIYGLSKYMCDIYSEYFSLNSDVNVLSVRLARLYGKGDRDGVLFKNFLERAKNRKPLMIHGDGTSSIEYIYIKDVVDFFITVLGRPNSSGIYNLGSGASYTIIQIAKMINKVFKNPEAIEFTNLESKSIQGLKMDSSKITKDFSFTPSWNLKTSVEDILNNY